MLLKPSEKTEEVQQAVWKTEETFITNMGYLHVLLKELPFHLSLWQQEGSQTA